MQLFLDAYPPYQSLQPLFRLTALEQSTKDCFIYRLDTPLLPDEAENTVGTTVPVNLLLQCAQSLCAQFTLIFLQRGHAKSSDCVGAIEKAQAPHPMATHFLQPITLTEYVGPYQVQVNVLRKGRSVSFCEVRVFDPDETILAQSNHTFALS